MNLRRKSIRSEESGYMKTIVMTAIRPGNLKVRDMCPLYAIALSYLNYPVVLNRNINANNVRFHLVFHI